MNYEKTVFRSIAFPVPTFDYLKNFQRGYERQHQVRINNNEALAIILGEHKIMTEENEEYEQLVNRV